MQKQLVRHEKLHTAIKVAMTEYLRLFSFLLSQSIFIGSYRQDDVCMLTSDINPKEKNFQRKL